MISFFACSPASEPVAIYLLSNGLGFIISPVSGLRGNKQSGMYLLTLPSLNASIHCEITSSNASKASDLLSNIDLPLSSNLGDLKNLSGIAII